MLEGDNILTVLINSEMPSIWIARQVYVMCEKFYLIHFKNDLIDEPASSLSIKDAVWLRMCSTIEIYIIEAIFVIYRWF